jgi:NADH-quinone oxidoreductase subunit M
MGFVTLGFFVIFAAAGAAPANDGARMAVQGGMMQMLSHGLISGALFLCVGVLYDRMHSREISAYGGVINTMPKFAALMVLFGLANAGLPGTSGFVGEFFVILGTFHADPWLAFLAATTLVFGAAYTLWMIKRVVFGEVANSNVAALTDVGPREFWMLMVLAVAVLIVGIWPAPLVDRMDASIGELLIHVGQPKL